MSRINPFSGSEETILAKSFRKSVWPAILKVRMPNIAVRLVIKAYRLRFHDIAQRIRDNDRMDTVDIFDVAAFGLLMTEK